MKTLTVQVAVQIPPLDFVAGRSTSGQTDHANSGVTVKAIDMTTAASTAWSMPTAAPTEATTTDTGATAATTATVLTAWPLPLDNQLAMYRVAVERSHTATDMTGKRRNQQPVATEEELLAIRMVLEEVSPDAAASEGAAPPLLTDVPEGAGSTLIAGVHTVTIVMRRDGTVADVTVVF